MSACISSKGEYSSHTTTEGNFICDDCGVLDEDGLFAERDTLRAERDRARSLAATLEARLAQVEALHVPCSEHPTCADADHFCHECGQSSPCTTVRFIHKESA